jgi:hypothetical protein
MYGGHPAAYRLHALALEREKEFVEEYRGEASAIEQMWLLIREVEEVDLNINRRGDSEDLVCFVFYTGPEGMGNDGDITWLVVRWPAS